VSAFSDQPRPGFWEAVDLFNDGEYFECHEVIEDFWRPLPVGDEKSFYQGILQVGVGFYHCQKNNWRGAKNLLAHGLERLSPLCGLAPYEDWLALTPFYQASELVYQQVLACTPETSALLPKVFPKIQKIEKAP
jgi:hypothetical protein